MEDKVKPKSKLYIAITVVFIVILASVATGYYFYRRTVEANLIDSQRKVAERYVEAGEFEKALKTYEKLKNLKGNLTEEELKSMATAAIGAGKKELAEEIYLEIIKKNPKDHEAHFNLALIAYDKRETTKAIEFAEKAASLRATYIAPRYFLAKQYLALSQYEKARDKYLEILRIDPKAGEKEPVLLKELAFCFDKLKDKPQAVFYYQQAMKYLPGDSEIIQALKRLKDL